MGAHKSGLLDDSIFYKESYAENLKKIVGAVWELPAKSTAGSAQFEWKWAGLAVLFSR